jgi:hypothetical protein
MNKRLKKRFDREHWKNKGQALESRRQARNEEIRAGRKGTWNLSLEELLPAEAMRLKH